MGATLEATMIEQMRIYGNLGLIAGQFALLFYSRQVGLCIILACSLINLPYFVRHKYYDIVLLIAVGMIINAVGLFWGVEHLAR
jgi:hypothetical protein